MRLKVSPKRAEIGTNPGLLTPIYPYANLLDRSMRNPDMSKFHTHNLVSVKLAQKSSLAILLLSLGLAGCAKNPEFDPALVRSARYQTELPAPSANEAVAARKEYQINPTDKLSIKFFGVSELDREVDVDTAGNIHLPLVDTIAAAGETAAGLAQKISSAYAYRYVRDPQVSVLVTSAVSQKALVDGAVQLPGEINITSTTTLMSAIASARGVTDKSRLDQVVVFRTIDGNRLVGRFNLNDIRLGKADDIPIFANDVVVVGSGSAKLEARDLILLAPLLNTFYQITR